MSKSIKQQVIELQADNTHHDEVIADDFVRNCVEGTWTSETIDKTVLPIWDNDEAWVRASTEQDKIEAIVQHISSLIAESPEKAREQVEMLTSDWSDETFENYCEGLELDLEEPSEDATAPKL